VSVLLTVLVLSLINPRNETKDTLNSVSLSSKEIVDKYKNEDITTKSEYKVAEYSSLYDSIKYTPVDGEYSIYVKPSNTIQYERTDKKTPDNSAELKTGTESFLVGLKLKRTQIYSLEGGSTLSLYDSSDVTCQVGDFLATELQPAAYNLACTPHSTAVSAYSYVEALLSLYRSAGGATTEFSSVVKSDVITEKGQSLQTLVTRSGEETDSPSITLIFATSSDTWEYIGERPTPSVDDEESFKIPDTLKSAIDESEYKNFFNKYIK